MRKPGSAAVLTKAVRLILPLWLVVKLAAFLITVLTGGDVDLTFINPGVEFGFSSLVFTDNTSLGLVIFIGFVVMTAVGYPLSFLVIHDGRVQNTVGFIAYAVITLRDIVSAAILLSGDGIFLVSLLLSLLTASCLLFYCRQHLLKTPDSFDDVDGEEA